MSSTCDGYGGSYYGASTAASRSRYNGVLMSTMDDRLVTKFYNRAEEPVSVVNNYNNCTFNYYSDKECVKELEERLVAMNKEEKEEILGKLDALSKQSDKEFKQGLAALIAGLVTQSAAPVVAEKVAPIVKDAMHKLINEDDSNKGFLKKKLSKILGTFISDEGDE